jgi:hypothetical protein
MPTITQCPECGRPPTLIQLLYRQPNGLWERTCSYCGNRHLVDDEGNLVREDEGGRQWR